ncbi:MAG: hypothetical protein ACTHOC_12830 [Luteimonas sp.]
MDIPTTWISAAATGDIASLRALHRAQIPMDQRALAVAIERNDSAAAEILLFSGADPDLIEVGDGP